MNIPGMGPRLRGQNRPHIGDDSGPLAHALRGRPLRVRRAAGRGVPARAAPLPLPLLLLRPAEPQLVRRWEGRWRKHGDGIKSRNEGHVLHHGVK